jgi:predicted phage terminase large subunit-like protein
VSAPLPPKVSAQGLREVFEELAKRPDAHEACAVYVDHLLEQLSDEEFQSLLYDWRGTWARRSQLLPTTEEWRLWVILAGRGFGKTRTAAEAVRELVEHHGYRHITMIGPTASDVRDTMIEGESGLIACSPPWFKPVYEPSKRRITWPNGARARLFSAEQPERLRGVQSDVIWGDEPASWGDDEDMWHQVKLGHRLGKRPVAIVSGTPKPIPLVLRWLDQAVKEPGRVIITRGSSYENVANLAPDYIRDLKNTYEGTRMGRQEVFAEVLTDMPGALFNQVIIDELRVKEPPGLDRIVIAIDPAPTSDEGSDEHGIVVVGRGFDGHGYVLEDLSGKYTPDQWARLVVKAFYSWKAESIVAEVNNGGDLVESNIRTVDPNVPFKGVRAMRGKAKRAEPIAALYEQRKIHHVGKPEKWQRLERQMRVFTGRNGRRDDRTDAMCWGLHELMLDAEGFFFA